MVITKDMTISKIINFNDETLEILEKYGLKCRICNGVYTETLESAVRANSLNLEKILYELNHLKDDKEV